MGTTSISAVTIDRDGASEATPTSLNNSDTFQVLNTGRTLLHFLNTGSEAIITFITPVTTSGLAVADVAVTVPATTGDVFVMPVPSNIFNNGSGYTQFTCDQATGVTCAALELDK